jgi:hypothetical protein
MTITAAALISTLVSQASNSTNRQSVAAPAAPQRPSVADTATISRAAQSALAAATGGTSPAQPDGATSGLGSVTGVSGTKYDFTNMTNAQAYAAANQLYSAGQITVGEQAQIQIMAQGGDTIRIPIIAQGGDTTNPANSGNTYFADNLKSATPHNFLTEVSNKLASDLRSPDPGGINAKLIATDKALVTDLTADQGTVESTNMTPALPDGIVSTAA